MRWPVRRRPKIGDTRSKSGFLWWPKRAAGEWRWLERATWIDRRTWDYGTCWGIAEIWKPVKWADAEENS